MSYHVSLVSTADLPLPVDTQTVWLNPLWMKAVSRVTGCDARYLICTEKSNQLAVMPLYIKQRLMIKKALNPVLSYYSPILYSIPQTSFPNRDLIRKLEINSAIAHFLKTEFSSYSLNLHPDVFDVRGFTWNNAIAKPLYTFTHQTNEDPKIFAEEERKLRIAQKSGFQFMEFYDSTRFCGLLDELYKLKKHDLGISLTKVQSFLDEIHSHGLIRQLNLMSGEDIICADMVICDGTDTAYALLRGTSEVARKKGASVMQNIYDAKHLAKDYIVLDYLGANVPGPARFKASFGYELKLFFRIQG